MDVRERGRIVDEVLMLLPVLMRELGRPDPVEMGAMARRGVSVDAHVSPGHVQVMILLGRGPHSVSELAEALGVSSPAVTQLVDRLAEIGMVRRRHDEEDRRRVLVEFVPGMQEIARGILERRRAQLSGAVERMTGEEARAFLRGLRLLVEGLGARSKEGVR